MMWMFDTNTVIYLVNRRAGHERIARRMSGRSPGELKLSAISLSELEYGIENASPRYRSQDRNALAEWLALVEVLDYPAAAARHYAEIRAVLTRKGRPTKAYDLQIGAHARSIGAALITNDLDDFRHMPGLTLDNWLQS
jgi:tRNA(fMet)-specific endonuclease VapC